MTAPRAGRAGGRKPQLDATLFGERDSLQLRTDLIDCHIAVCSVDVLVAFSDNFDYQAAARAVPQRAAGERGDLATAAPPSRSARAVQQAAPRPCTLCVALTCALRRRTCSATWSRACSVRRSWAPSCTSTWRRRVCLAWPDLHAAWLCNSGCPASQQPAESGQAA